MQTIWVILTWIQCQVTPQLQSHVAVRRKWGGSLSDPVEREQQPGCRTLESALRATLLSFHDKVRVLVCLFTVWSANDYPIKICRLLPLGLSWPSFLFSTPLGGTCHWPNTLNQIYSTERGKNQPQIKRDCKGHRSLGNICGRLTLMLASLSRCLGMN